MKVGALTRLLADDGWMLVRTRGSHRQYNPGFGGQPFIPSSYAKLRQIKTLVGTRPVEISVDGGVNRDKAGPLAQAGATFLVARHSRHRARVLLRWKSIRRARAAALAHCLFCRPLNGP